MTKLIELKQVSVARSGKNVLSNVSVELQCGEIVTVVGPNGSGKTTLLRTILGAQTHSTGIVWRKPDLRIGYVPQKLAIDNTLPITVRRFLDLPKKAKKADAEKALARTGALELAQRPISALSGGQLQRVLLARAILGEPELLVLDEPTQGLDQPGSAALYETIEELRHDLDCGVLMVSHELHVVMATSDRVICLNGHVCCAGAPEQVATAPEYRALFGTGTKGTLALYRHEHDHAHDHAGHSHD